MTKRPAADDGAAESLRLKTLAAESYDKSNFSSALNYAKRAQRLNPNLNELTEMVTALRILRAAEERTEGLGSANWYKILQIEPFSSVEVVKKRYKKLALSLHPDKSSFAGCGEAFKLVGEAFRCLVSVERRKEFDLKVRVWIQDEVMRKGEVGRSDDDDVTESDKGSDGEEGGMRTEKESIIVYCRRKKLCNAGALRSERMKVVGEEMTLAELQMEAKMRKKSSLEKNTMKKRVSLGNGKEKAGLRGDDLRNGARKGSRKDDTDDEDQDSETEVLKLSELRKKKVDVANAKSMSWKSFSDDGRIGNGHSEGNFEVMTVDDSDFYDFDKDRVEKSFELGQVWAIYDDEDGMPRHYGLIDEVVSINPFEVKMSWLDLQINSDEVSILASSESHISCGRFKVDKKTVINSVNFFSHVVNCDRAAKEVYWIYPKKGSVWALYSEEGVYQDGGEPLARDKRSFSIVVCLTSYSEMHGLSMAYLEKVDRFKTLFKRQQIGAHAIIWMEKINVQLFSHQIPARKLSEAEGPMFKDCWELDPASLPQNLVTDGYEK